MTKDISTCKTWLEAWDIYYGPEKEIEPEDPNAICVSSVDDQGMPNGRFVLLKEVTEIGFLFYTNLDSTKGKELFSNKKGVSDGVVSTHSIFLLFCTIHFIEEYIPASGP